MIRKSLFVLLFGAALLLTADSEASWFGGKGRSEDRTRPEPHRYRDVPRCGLVAGELTHGSRGGWRLDGREIVLAPDCRVEVAGRQVGKPVPAAKAMVLGSRRGDVVVARQIRIHKAPLYDPLPDGDRYGIKWSDANPNVGVATVRGIE